MYEFTADGPVTAHLHVSGGRCAVHTGDGPTVTVDVTPAASWRPGDRKAAERTEVRFDAGVLTVRNGQAGAWTDGSVRLRVTVPANSALTYASHSADLEAHGRLASLAADSGSGGVKADHITGDVRLEATSGDVELGTVGGSLTYTIRSGHLRVGHTAGPVRGTSASGDLRLGTADQDVHVETGSGDVRIGTVRTGTLHATTSSGDVTVGVEKGVGVRPTLRTNSGDRHGDLAHGAPADGFGEITVDITTTSGDITLRRA
ncbi:DUF4097 family beta strand repeat-containing protein [Streptomyces sp. NPDC004542]|uniref:DUF4097 family beta strand repeat-containing protein n=1 Tax=Streptomyces sp. NPDC004542 TaxID=3154281 RepID=UPI0033AFB1B9